MSYLDGKNQINISDLILKEKKISTFKKISVQTNNNNFSIEADKIISIKGKKFDATNLAKLFKYRNNENQLEKISSDIQIDLQNIIVPNSENLKNFKLIGKIKKVNF